MRRVALFATTLVFAITATMGTAVATDPTVLKPKTGSSHPVLNGNGVAKKPSKAKHCHKKKGKKCRKGGKGKK